MKDLPLIVPVRSWKPQRGRFNWPDRPVLRSQRDVDDLSLGQLAGDLKRSAGASARIEHGAGSDAAVCVRRVTRPMDGEGYRMEISKDSVTIEAGTDAGVFYAVQTLRELVRAFGGRLPVGRIDDRPDFARRGVYHDCSRGKVPTVDTLRELIERLAGWKVNELQLYIENVFTFASHPKIGRGFSPFTPDDMLAIQTCAKKHHMRLVPSLASLGHMEKILALPEYRSLGELPGHHGRPGGTTLCPTDPGSIKLIADLYADFLPLFESEEFNICGDEPWELGQGRSKRAAERLGVGALYAQFLAKLQKLCEKHGKRMNAWADIVLQHPEMIDQLPRDIVLLNWDYNPKGNRIPRTDEITNAGIDCIVCPGTHGWNSHGSRQDQSTANVRRFAGVGRKHGAIGLLNTDWGDGGHRNTLGVSLRGFAHGAAHAWNGRAVDEDSFTQRFCKQMFSDDAALPGLVDQMGLAQRAFGRTRPYNVVCEPIDRKQNPYKGIRQPSPVLTNPQWRKGSFIEMVDGATYEAAEKAVVARDAWPKPMPQLPKFEQLALREYALASEMDRLAALRGSATLRRRAGQSVSNKQRREILESWRYVIATLETLWNARNRPSRLADNLRLLRAVRDGDKVDL